MRYIDTGSCDMTQEPCFYLI